MIDLNGLKTAGKLLALAGDLQKVDADGNGKSDLGEIIADLSLLPAQVAAAKAALEVVAATTGRIAARVGKDIEHVRDKLGLPQQLAAALVDAHQNEAVA